MRIEKSTRNRIVLSFNCIEFPVVARAVQEQYKAAAKGSTEALIREDIAYAARVHWEKRK